MSYRRSRGMALRPVHRIKHVVDSQFGVVGGTPARVNVIQSKDAPVLANTSEVETGSKVNGIFLIVEVSMTSGVVLANAYMLVAKRPGGNITIPDGNVVGADDNKRFVFHQEMVMMQKFDADVASNPRTLFKGVVVIPRGYRRMGPNDIIEVQVFTPTGQNMDACVQCHYKEFR